MELVVTDVGPKDFERHQVWEYFDKPGVSEVMIRTVAELPIAELSNRVVAALGQLACGKTFWLVFTGLHADEATSKVTRDVYVYDSKGKKFRLTNRAEDIGSLPQAIREMEQFVGLAHEQIFPIRYDLNGIVTCANPIGFIGVDDLSGSNADYVLAAQLAAQALLSPRHVK